MIKPPKIIVIPESTGYVNTGCFDIVNCGEFSSDGFVQLSCEYTDAESNIKIHDCYIAEVSKKNGVENVYYYKDIECPVEFHMTNTKRLKYKKGEFGKEISVGIAYPQNMKIKDEIHNILII